MNKINILINGKNYSASVNQNILHLALENGIDIPHFCYHEDLPIDANCRTCLVEVSNVNQASQATKPIITTSCTLIPKEGMIIKTQSERLDKLRKVNMELLLADHLKYCPKCQKNLFCKVRETMNKYGVDSNKYQRDKVECPLVKLGSAAELDPRICIDCNKCAEICEKMGIGFLKMEGTDSKTRMSYSKDPKVDCIYCGQCTVHCLVGAIREQDHIADVEKALKDKKKIVIVQTAPSVRASIGEEFDMPYGTNAEGKLITAYRQLGFDKVFDVNMGADITTIVEAEELIERITEKGKLPMFTSCCPGWVKYVEFYHPEIIPYLTTSRSPQIHSGGAYKTWWAQKEKIDPKNIVVVSVMPCTSKKYEANHEKLNINGLKPVDYSLTTRELALMLKKNKIDLAKLKNGKLDREGLYSGAAVIYGASGGVMESALRTAYYKITGKDLKNIELKQVRGTQGIKTAKIKIGKTTLKIAVVATAKNAAKIIEEIKKNPKAYDYIEVMACPGGCIGGGGQPIPSTDRIVKKRIAGLYAIDHQMKMRKAHENPIVQEFFEWTDKLTKKEKNEILYTTYHKRKKFE